MRMTTIKLTFPWGRYYAHPWGVNPGRLREAEWPPSPWRLMRALVSAWFRAHPGQTPSLACIQLIELLAAELPAIGMGKISFGYTVHWQPNYGAAMEGKPEVVKRRKENAEYKPTRHENYFVALSSPVFFRWTNVSLTAEQQALLRSLLAEITYFGRAESVCHAEVCETEPPAETRWCCPTNGRRISASCRDVFCPIPGDFQFADLWSRRGDPARNDLHNAPPHFVDRLLSTEIRTDGGNLFSYQMPEGWPAKWVSTIPKSARKPRALNQQPVARTLRFSLQCRIPIPLKYTVDIAERFRKSAIKRFKETPGGEAHSFALSGHPPAPPYATGDHQHAHFLPLPRQLDRCGFIEEMHVWAPCGFTQPEVEALMRVKTVYWGAADYPIRPVLLEISNRCPDFLAAKPATIWRSLTPFVPPRHFYRGNLHGAKLKAKDSPEHQLAEMLELAGVDPSRSVVIHRLTTNGSAQSTNPPQAEWDIVRTPADEEAFVGGISTMVHANGKGAERRIGFFFRIESHQPVVIPRPLGHSAHFGMGLFVPDDANAQHQPG
jgi:CRISPR-associated protein Csb2